MLKIVCSVAELVFICYIGQVKYSLVEAIAGAIFYERSYDYAHVNFYAAASNGPKKNGPKVLVFAELQHVGRRLNAMALRSFHFLDGKKQTGK